MTMTTPMAKKTASERVLDLVLHFTGTQSSLAFQVMANCALLAVMEKHLGLPVGPDRPLMTGDGLDPYYYLGARLERIEARLRTDVVGRQRAQIIRKGIPSYFWLGEGAE